MKLTFHNFSFIKQFQISLLNNAYIICSADWYIWHLQVKLFWKSEIILKNM